MTHEMNWKECIDRGIIVKSLPDKERAEQMLKMANTRLKFWESLRQITSDEYISLFVEAYYDIIKELIFANIYKKGYNCSNHLCLIAYLKENIKDFDYEIQKIDELRKLRNEISYRGLNVKKDFIERNELEFKSIIKKLKEKLEK